jgi:hypothetical protein
MRQHIIPNILISHKHTEYNPIIPLGPLYRTDRKLQKVPNLTTQSERYKYIDRPKQIVDTYQPLPRIAETKGDDSCYTNGRQDTHTRLIQIWLKTKGFPITIKTTYKSCDQTTQTDNRKRQVPIAIVKPQRYAFASYLSNSDIIYVSDSE